MNGTGEAPGTRRGRVARLRAAVLVFVCLGGAMACSSPPAPESCADLVLTGGNLVTMDAAMPRAEAMAVRDDRILAVGASAEILAAHACGHTEQVDLAGRTVLPGLIDAHAHLGNLGRSLGEVDLVGTASVEEVAGRVAARVRDSRPGEWIRGRGWDQNDWEVKEFPQRAALDAVSPRNPVALTRVDGHAVFANSLALEAGGVGRETSDPAGGEILRDAAGLPTGVLIDNATELVEGVIPEPTPEQRRGNLARAMAHCVALGLTGAHDAGIDYEDWDDYRAMADAGEMPLRVYAMLGLGGADGLQEITRAPEIGRAGGRLTVRTVKLYADGALGSRGAALLADYTDRPGHRGLLLNEPSALERFILAGAARGYQIAVHAIGDRGNREVLDLYERLLGGARRDDLRPRIEHAQILALDDIPRFARLGVLPAMQPTHATSDMYWAVSRLGEERLRGAYAWRSLLEAGSERLPLGSDFPVESANPFWGIYAAVTRQDADGQPPEGWLPQQRLSREEALRGFTLDAAFAAFEEKEKGSLSPGKLADFVILDRDPMTVTPAELREARALETWVGGRRVYAAPGSP